MSDTQQSLQIMAFTVETARALLDFIAVGGKHSEGRMLVNLATQESDIIAKRLTDEKQVIEAAAFQRGADEQRRMDKIMVEHTNTIDPALLNLDDFLDPNGKPLLVSEGATLPQPLLRDGH